MNDILNVIKNNNKFNITFHISADGDSIGSSLALMQGLRKIKKECCILSKEAVPSFLSFLPFSNEINGEGFECTDDSNVLICLDCGNVERLNMETSTINKKTVLNIDHHVANDYYGDYNYVDTNASSMGEIVYTLLKELNIDIDKEMAMCLYTSIVSDTGWMRFSNTTENTHKIVADLVGKGIDVPEIYSRLYENKQLEYVKLYGKAIENLQFAYDNKLCIMEFSLELLSQFGEASKDAGSLTGIGFLIEDVEVVALLKEVEDGVKVSLRSKSDIDVNKIANVFDGGGHKKAAGCLIKNSLADVKQMILDEVRRELKKNGWSNQYI